MSIEMYKNLKEAMKNERKFPSTVAVARKYPVDVQVIQKNILYTFLDQARESGTVFTNNWIGKIQELIEYRLGGCVLASDHSKINKNTLDRVSKRAHYHAITLFRRMYYMEYGNLVEADIQTKAGKPIFIDHFGNAILKKIHKKFGSPITVSSTFARAVIPSKYEQLKEYENKEEIGYSRDSKMRFTYPYDEELFDTLIDIAHNLDLFINNHNDTVGEEYDKRLDTSVGIIRSTDHSSKYPKKIVFRASLDNVGGWTGAKKNDRIFNPVGVSKEERERSIKFFELIEKAVNVGLL